MSTARILRLIVTTTDYTLAANVGGPIEVTSKTFDVDCPPELATFLENMPAGACVTRWIAGVEVREP